MPRHSPLSWLFRFVILIVLFAAFFVLGSMAVGGAMPEMAAAEPGLVPDAAGSLILVVANVAVIASLILASRWGGWKLAILLAFAYYGAVTFVTQIETWYFLSSLTVSADLLPRLFLMGIPTAFFFIPLAVWILGKGHAPDDTAPNAALMMPPRQWLWKLAVLAILYLALYWGAGYFIAWQNPELRAFYGQPGPAQPFLANLAGTLREDPGLFLFQIFRSQLWILCTLPVIRGSRIGVWWTALLVGVFLSVPQNIGHLLANPLIPIASVRLSHLIETASSTFVYGAIVVWLLHRQHDSLADLFGRREAVSDSPGVLVAE
jgi:hypothetical protein